VPLYSAPIAGLTSPAVGGNAMDNESLEKTRTRKWQQMSVEERRQEIEMLSKSGYSNLLSIIMLQQKLKDII
jgi:hypothetical protein